MYNNIQEGTRMIIKGKYGEAKVFADIIDENAIASIKRILDLPYMEGSQVSIMPDVGYVSDYCVTGYVQKGGKINPDSVSADFNCGVLIANLGKVDIDLEAFDKAVKEVNESKDRSDAEFDFTEFICPINESKALNSISLGSGNHYCEIDTDNAGNVYLNIHSGARNLGGQIFKHYQELAYKRCNSNKEEKLALIKKLKEEGREKEIQSELEKISKPEVKKAMCWLEGKDLEDYIHDSQLAGKFASYNRYYLANKILSKVGLEMIDSFETVHNYVDKDGIVRKGAISAKKGELIYIALSMKEGGLICEGLGNEEYLCSAPHGAGRLMSRKEAKEKISLEEFKESMRGIYSSTINKNTLDEAPMAYKRVEDIIPTLEGTARVIKHIKPIYNYKEEEAAPWLKKSTS